MDVKYLLAAILCCRIIYNLDGSKKIAKEYTGDKSNPEQAGIELAEMVLAAGGDKILEEIYS